MKGNFATFRKVLSGYAAVADAGAVAGRPALAPPKAAALPLPEVAPAAEGGAALPAAGPSLLETVVSQLVGIMDQAG